MIRQPSRFAFLDEGEAVRRLGVDRDTLLTFVREGRLRAYPGVGKGNFYKTRDLDALLAELRGTMDQSVPEPAEAEAARPGRKSLDPASKVHVRLQADLKWYNLQDEDFQAWVRELHPDGYQRQRANILSVMARLQRLVDLMDEAASKWQTLQAPRPLPSPPAAPAQPASRPPRKPLSMAPGQAAPQPRTPGKPLPMAQPPRGEPSPPETGTHE